ncbi:recombination protein NinB [Rhizobium pusense]|uniref:recombination protein NinB n=1 Tax=Agrobacterium pusense TaxID=648995 RepID=UPI00244AA964|nr:recombination protein NinB [Agrobacterium pusense]MDH2092678.1 recombination protein NinB [Agrobacterium pusense]
MSTREAVIINTPADREKVVRWARGVSDGTIVEFRKSTRSHEQNAKMHAMLGEVSDQVVWYGQKLKVEDWKNMFTASLRKASVVPGIDPGTVVPLVCRRSRKGKGYQHVSPRHSQGQHQSGVGGRVLRRGAGL